MQIRYIYEIPPATELEPLNRTLLDHSLELGTQFMLNHQKPEGNFTYIYDWVKQTYDPGDNQVRQAGAMWGLALIYGDYVIDLANWMIDVHKTLKKTRNTAYAYEGIIHAYQLAVQRKDTEHIKKFDGEEATGLKQHIHNEGASNNETVTYC